MRAATWGRGHDLPAHKQALLSLAARLYVHAINVSNKLYYLGETRQDDEPRQLLKEARDLVQLVSTNFARVFPDDETETDVFGKYTRGEP